MMRNCVPIRRGFWLVETAGAIAVIGVGIVAMMSSHQAWHVQAATADRLATGMRLAGEIREFSLLLAANDPVTGTAIWGTEPGESLPWDADDLDDLDDAVFAADLGTGPIDATGSVISGMDGWSQQVTVSCVDPFNITATVSDGSSQTLRVEVAASLNGNELARLSWTMSP